MNEDVLRSIFTRYNTIAVCGMSRSEHKSAHSVPRYMMQQGYKIIPVNPFAETILGLSVYPTLADVPDHIDIVNVFRPSAGALDIVKEAIDRRRQKGDIDVVWLQLGIHNDEARQLAEAEGITFIQNRCIYVDHSRLA